MKYEVVEIDLNFYYQDLHVFIPIVGALVSFAIYWFTWQSDTLKDRLIASHGHDIGSSRLVIYTKILGGLLLCLLPSTAYLLAFPSTTLTSFGWSLPNETLLATIVWTICLGLLMVIIVGHNARKPEHLKQYPQIRARVWNRSMLLWDLISWAIFLIGYESLFRGLLLFPLIDHIGLWPSIAINIGLYAGTHIPKGLKETIGSMPFGIALCILTVQVGNIWPAVIIHIAMAWTNEIVSLKFNQEMVLVD